MSTRTDTLAWLGFAGGYAGGQAASSALTSALRRQNTAQQYQDLPLPAYAPPPATFGIVWSGLNVASATSAWLVWRAGRRNPLHHQQSQRALRWWAAAVVVRSAYTPLEFGRRALWPATGSSLALALVMGRYAKLAAEVDSVAGALAAPEVAWSGFATMLSADIARRD